MRNITHIINPVLVAREQDYSKLALAQPFTFASIQRARAFARPAVDVDVLAVGFEKDLSIVPDDFRTAVPLMRSVLDVETFNVPRRLPILRDILETAQASSDAEYLVYSNVDIGVLDNFYTVIDKVIDRGFDAFTMTRRTLPMVTTDLADLPLIQSLVGETHPGHDCFVFHRRLLDGLILGETCVGGQFLVPPFLANLVCRSKKFGRFDELHLTFHLGDDRVWKTEKFQDYADFNFKEAAKVFREFQDRSLLVSHWLVKYWLQRFTPDIEFPSTPVAGRSLWREPETVSRSPSIKS